MVGMTVNVEIVYCVVHVLGRVDLVKLTFAVCDVERFLFRKMSMLAQEGTSQRSIMLTGHVVEWHLVELCKTDECKEFPSVCQSPKLWQAKNALSTKPVGSKPGHSLATTLSLP